MTNWNQIIQKKGFLTEKEMWDYYYIKLHLSPEKISYEMDEYNVTTAMISLRLMKLGYVFDKKARYAENHRRLWEPRGYKSRKEMLNRLYTTLKWSQSRIGKALDMSATCVGVWLKQDGIPRRGKGGPNNVEHYRKLRAQREAQTI